MTLTLDEQHEILAKRAHLQGERKRVVDQLATWEKCVAQAHLEIADFDKKIAELEAKLK